MYLIVMTTMSIRQWHRLRQIVHTHRFDDNTDVSLFSRSPIPNLYYCFLATNLLNLSNIKKIIWWKFFMAFGQFYMETIGLAPRLFFNWSVIIRTVMNVTVVTLQALSYDVHERPSTSR